MILLKESGREMVYFLKRVRAWVELAEYGIVSYEVGIKKKYGIHSNAIPNPRLSKAIRPSNVSRISLQPE